MTKSVKQQAEVIVGTSGNSSPERRK